MMKLSKPVTESIKVRRSCRTYAKTPIEKNKRELIEQFIDELSTDNFMFQLIDKYDGGSASEKLGTYGVIQGATTFIAGVMKKGFQTIEYYGLAFEKIILFLTGMNLGTCWIGASFDRKKFSNRLQVSESEIVPVITPVGYPGSGFNFHSSLIKLIARPDKRVTWDKLFFSENFSMPLSSDIAGEYADALEMIRLGPSAGNLQPWRILKAGSTFHFYLERSSFYTNRLIYDIQRIDIGIAMCHFELAAHESGLNGSWTVQNPDIVSGGDNLDYIVSWVYN